MTTELLDLQDVGSESRFQVGTRSTLSVCAAAQAAATWSSGVLTLQVSSDGVNWFDAVTLTGSSPAPLSADGGIDSVYVGDVLWARVVVTTPASGATQVEVRWP